MTAHGRTMVNHGSRHDDGYTIVRPSMPHGMTIWMSHGITHGSQWHDHGIAMVQRHDYGYIMA